MGYVIFSALWPRRLGYTPDGNFSRFVFANFVHHMCRTSPYHGGTGVPSLCETRELHGHAMLRTILELRASVDKLSGDGYTPLMLTLGPDMGSSVSVDPMTPV